MDVPGQDRPAEGAAALRAALRLAERAPQDEQLTALSFAAGAHVALDEAERAAAVRRSLLLLAAGGDPRRRLEPYGRAVSALAEDLDAPERRRALAAGLADLEGVVAGLRGLGESLRLLRRDPDLAWRAYALALLADALTDDEP